MNYPKLLDKATHSSSNQSIIMSHMCLRLSWEYDMLEERSGVPTTA